MCFVKNGPRYCRSLYSRQNSKKANYIWQVFCAFPPSGRRKFSQVYIEFPVGHLSVLDRDYDGGEQGEVHSLLG
jgi:hypothetical protein